MKKYSFQLHENQASQFFSPIRNKQQIIHLLMRTIKLMLVADNFETERNFEIILFVSKMSRLFYISDKKYFSINFPFTVIENDGRIEFTYKNLINVDNRVTSDVLTILNHYQRQEFNHGCVFDFIDPITEIMQDNEYFWLFFKELMTFEDGYIRYDYDEKMENGDLHPLHHYDVFYNSNNTFKIGLRRSISKEILIDFLQTESKCQYLEIYPNS